MGRWPQPTKWADAGGADPKAVRLIRLVAGIRPEQLDLRASLFQRAQRLLRGQRVTVDREVQVEAVLERTAHHRPAVEPRQVHIAPGEAIQRVGQAARAMRGDERQRAFPSGLALPWPRGI